MTSQVTRRRPTRFCRRGSVQAVREVDAVVRSSGRRHTFSRQRLASSSNSDLRATDHVEPNGRLAQPVAHRVVTPEGVAVRRATHLARQLYRIVVAGWDNLRPHTGALVAVAVYFVAVYLIGRR